MQKRFLGIKLPNFGRFVVGANELEEEGNVRPSERRKHTHTARYSSPAANATFLSPAKLTTLPPPLMHLRSAKIGLLEGSACLNRKLVKHYN